MLTSSAGRWHRGGQHRPPRPSDAGPPRWPIGPGGEWLDPLQLEVETEYRRHRQLELQVELASELRLPANASQPEPDSEPQSPSERGTCHGISNLNLAGWQAASG